MLSYLLCNILTMTGTQCATLSLADYPADERDHSLQDLHRVGTCKCLEIITAILENITNVYTIYCKIE